MSTSPIDVAREALEDIARGDTFQHPNAVEKSERARIALDAVKRLEVEAEALAADARSGGWFGARCLAALGRSWRAWLTNASYGPPFPPPPPRPPIGRKVTGWEFEVTVGGVTGSVDVRRGSLGTDAEMAQTCRVMIEVLGRLSGPACSPAPGGPGRVGLQFRIGPISDKRQRTMLVLKATQKVLLSLVFTDAKGNAAAVDGAPKWDVSAPEVGTLQVAEDGMSATLFAGSVTTGQVNVTADADLGDGVKPLTGVLDVQVLAGDAALIAISAAAPEDQ